MWRVGRSGREPHEERLVRRDRSRFPHPRNRAVRQLGRQVIVATRVHAHHRPRVLVQRRLPLADRATHEAVEVFESLPGRPAIKRPARAAFPVRGVVPFAQRGSCVTIEPQDFRNACDRPRPCAVVSGIPGRIFGHRSVPGRVGIASRQHRGTRRRAQGGRVIAVVAQAVCGQPVEHRRRHGASERSELGKPDVVEKNHEDIRRAARRAHDMRPVGL